MHSSSQQGNPKDLDTLRNVFRSQAVAHPTTDTDMQYVQNLCAGCVCVIFLKGLWQRPCIPYLPTYLLCHVHRNLHSTAFGRPIGTDSSMLGQVCL